MSEAEELCIISPRDGEEGALQNSPDTSAARVLASGGVASLQTPEISGKLLACVHTEYLCVVLSSSAHLAHAFQT